VSWRGRKAIVQSKALTGLHTYSVQHFDEELMQLAPTK